MPPKITVVSYSGKSGEYEVNFLRLMGPIPLLVVNQPRFLIFRLLLLASRSIAILLNRWGMEKMPPVLPVPVLRKPIVLTFKLKIGSGLFCIGIWDCY